MAITKAELDQFHRFACEKLSNGAADASLEELVRLWQEERDFAETVDDIRQGQKDLEAGKGQALDEAFAEVRRDLGLGK